MRKSRENNETNDANNADARSSDQHVFPEMDLSNGLTSQRLKRYQSMYSSATSSFEDAIRAGLASLIRAGAFHSSGASYQGHDEKVYYNVDRTAGQEKFIILHTASVYRKVPEGVYRYTVRLANGILVRKVTSYHWKMITNIQEHPKARTTPLVTTNTYLSCSIGNIRR